jgi:transcriptional regulator with XRE-family HTH domain
MAAAARRKAGDLDALIGQNVRRIREQLGATQDDLAQALKQSGWRASGLTVMALERGERALLHEEVLLLGDVLNVGITELYATAADYRFVSLGSLYPENADALAKRLTQAPRSEAKTWAELQRHRRTMGFGTDTAHVESFARGSLGYSPDDEATREAERHAAERLGVSPDEIVRRSYALWGRTLSDERNLRAEARVDETMRDLRNDLVRAEARVAKGGAHAKDRRELADARTRVTETTPRQRAAVRAHVTRELLAELEAEPQEEQ